MALQLELIRTNRTGSRQTWKITETESSPSTSREFDVRCSYGDPEPQGKGLDKKLMVEGNMITVGQIIGYAISTGAVTALNEPATVTLEWLE